MNIFCRIFSIELAMYTLTTTSGFRGGPQGARAPPPLLKFQRGSSNGTAAAPPPPFPQILDPPLTTVMHKRSRCPLAPGDDLGKRLQPYRLHCLVDLSVLAKSTKKHTIERMCYKRGKQNKDLLCVYHYRPIIIL